MSISMRASQRRAAATLIAVIAASCALPGYEVGETSSSASSVSASSVSASSAGGGGPSTAASTSGGGGQGGQNTGGEGGAGGGLNNSCVQDALIGAPCMNGAECKDIPPSGCEFRAQCEQSQWVILKSGEHCPPSDLTRLKGASCNCEKPQFCKVTKDCSAPDQPKGQLAVCDEANKAWTVFVSPAVCCGPNDVCYPAKEACVHVESSGGQVMSSCKLNNCASQMQPLSCMGCGETLCPDGCTCEIPAGSENHMKCTQCP